MSSGIDVSRISMNKLMNLHYPNSYVTKSLAFLVKLTITVSDYLIITIVAGNLLST